MRHRYQSLAEPRATAALAAGTPVLVPVNPIEHHGPHLSPRNDVLVCAGLLRDVHAHLAADHPEWPLLTLPDLEQGPDPVPGPGTVAVPVSTVRRSLAATVRTLQALGARRVVLLTFHGGLIHGLLLAEAAAWLERRGVAAVAPFGPLVRRLLTGDAAAYLGLLAAAEADPSSVAGLVNEFHAGCLETSLALHYAPETVSPAHRDVPDCPPLRPGAPWRWAETVARGLGRPVLARELAFAGAGLAWFGLRPFPGYSGKPRLASAALGRAVADRFARDLAALAADRFDRGRDPGPPLLRWVGPLTLGGRLGARIG